MSKKQYMGIIVLVIIILIFPFYWFSIRPIEIKKDCFQYAERVYETQAEYLDLDVDRNEWFKSNYEFCLMKAGL